MIVYGFHGVRALLQHRWRVSSIYVLRKKKEERLEGLLSMVKEQKLSCQELDHNRYQLAFQKAGGRAEELSSTQGIFALVPDFPYIDYESLLEKPSKGTLLLFVDSVTDPQNIGSILRSGAAFGLDGLVVTKDRASPLTPAAIKVSSGGFTRVPITRVKNLVRAIEMAQKRGFWVYGLSEHGDVSLSENSFSTPSALVVGSEEKGLRRLVAKQCDSLLKINAQKDFSSLNAAVASAVALALVREKQKF